MSGASGTGCLREFRQIHADERTRLGLAQNLAAVSGAGLALSGGGIRSASFALGVVQALVNRNWFSRFDYLSTVSGGGYLGAALSWLQLRYGPGFTAQLGSANRGARSAEQGGAGAAAGTWLDYLRQHGNYLEPGALGGLSLFGVVLRGVLLSVAVYGGAIAVLFALIGAAWLPAPCSSSSFLHPGVPIEYAVDSLALLLGLQIVVYGIATWLAAVRPKATLVGGAVVTVASGLVAAHFGATDAAAWRTAAVVWIVPWSLTFLSGVLLTAAGAWAVLVEGKASPVDAWHYRARTLLQRALAALLALLIALLVAWSVPISFGWLGAEWAVLAGAGTLSLGSALAALKSFGGDGLAVLGRLPKGLVVSVAALLAIYALLLVGYWVQHEWLGARPVLVAACVAVVVAGFIVDVNYIGPGRMYRDRLMEAFLPDTAAIAAGQWQVATEADGVRIDAFAGIKPYHLVNCNAVLVDAGSDKFRGRGGDSFVIAPLYSGSSATGWIRSEELGGHRGMPLATAMATSGAAVNPDAGVAGRGLTRDRAVAFLMWLFNVRLGYWLRNPGTGWLGRCLAFGPPNFWFPGILQGLLGQRLNERAAFVELSDGGHFDNTGLYELIRRRTRVIVVSEAGADPQGTLEDLSNAIERVRVDFGVHIRFDVEGLGVLAMQVSAATAPYAARGFAVATVHYPSQSGAPPAGELRTSPGDTGYLLYLQAMPVEALKSRPDVESYRLRNTSFPNESTANQFFTEEQLEAYRELGLMIANAAIEALDPQPAAGGPPDLVPLFEALPRARTAARAAAPGAGGSP